MDIFELKNFDGKIQKFRGFNIKPESGLTVRIIKNNKEDKSKLDPRRVNVYNDLSLDKVYKIYRVVNVNQVIVIDDTNCNVHLYPSQFQIVEELTSKEVDLIQINKLSLIRGLLHKNQRG